MISTFNNIFILEIAIMFADHDILNDDIIGYYHQGWENMFAQVGKKFKPLFLGSNIYISWNGI